MPNTPEPIALLPNPYYVGDRPATKRTPVMHYWASIPDEVLQFPGFTCLPVAVWNARVMVEMPTEVKRLDIIRRRVMQQMGLSNRQKGTPVLRYLETHNARSRDVQFVSIQSHEKQSLDGYDVRAIMEEAETDVAIAICRTPSHAFAMVLDGGELHMVDNGSFDDWDRWRVSNITRVIIPKPSGPEHSNPNIYV